MSGGTRLVAVGRWNIVLVHRSTSTCMTMTSVLRRRSNVLDNVPPTVGRQCLFTSHQSLLEYSISTWCISKLFAECTKEPDWSCWKCTMWLVTCNNDVDADLEHGWSTNIIVKSCCVVNSFPRQGELEHIHIVSWNITWNSCIRTRVPWPVRRYVDRHIVGRPV